MRYNCILMETIRISVIFSHHGSIKNPFTCCIFGVLTLFFYKLVSFRHIDATTRQMCFHIYQSPTLQFIWLMSNLYYCNHVVQFTRGCTSKNTLTSGSTGHSAPQVITCRPFQGPPLVLQEVCLSSSKEVLWL